MAVKKPPVHVPKLCLYIYAMIHFVTIVICIYLVTDLVNVRKELAELINSKRVNISSGTHLNSDISTTTEKTQKLFSQGILEPSKEQFDYNVSELLYVKAKQSLGSILCVFGLRVL